MKEKQTNDSVHVYLQEVLTGDTFIREMKKWFTEVEDERMRLLGKLLFEIELSEEEIYKYVNNNFNFSVDNIIKELDLQKPIYYPLAAYGHFGRNDIECSWEKVHK